MKKRTAALCLALTILMTILSGCAAEPQDYPVIEMADFSNFAMETASDDQVKVSYPAELWQVEEGSAPLTLLLTETVGSEQTVNVNVQRSSKFSGQLTEKDRTRLMETFKDYEGFMNFTVSEMRMLKDKPVIYTESTSKINDAYIDMILEQGIITEEWLAENGGREALLSIPETTQITLYAVRESYICVYVGTYYDEADKGTVLDLITLLYDGTDVL